MEYYPYLRGKQYELICVRENARLIAEAGFTPILEPVRTDIASFKRCLDSVADAGARVLVVENPGCGSMEGGVSDAFCQIVREAQLAGTNVNWLHRYSTGSDVSNFLEREQGGAILHDSPASAAHLKAAEVALGWQAQRHIFVEHRDSGLIYRRQFAGLNRILLQDGFRKKKNSAYLDEPVEHYSDLYLTYQDFGMSGFGDFLTVGDDYSESGGPAYAVAIHITFVDPSRYGSLFLHHFVSDSNETPADPAGKFSEALEKLASEARRTGTKIAQTAAVNEFLALHDRGHYPGLGYVKKLSMQHHLEVMHSLAVS